MYFLFFLIALPQTLCQFNSFTSKATVHSDNSGKTACGTPQNDENRISVDSSNFFKLKCGQRMTLTNTKNGKQVQGFIQDRNDGAKGNSIDISSKMNSRLGGNGRDNLEFVSIEIDAGRPSKNDGTRQEEFVESFDFFRLKGSFLAANTVRVPVSQDSLNGATA